MTPDAPTTPKKRRTRSWKTLFHEQQANYYRMQRLVVAAGAIGFLFGLALGAWIW